MRTVKDRVERIIASAASEAESEIKKAVLRRMVQVPRPGGFLFAMGSAFWIRDDGENAEYGEIRNTEDIDIACDAFLDAFGSMMWRVDYVDGELVERTDW
jgi:hypothetical protein